MRLEILNTGYSFGIKLLFGLVRMVIGRPVPDAGRIIFYRPDFYGKVRFTHEAMRGPSAWSIGDRELMAAFVSKRNECKWCVGAHTATTEIAYGDKVKVTAVLSDLDASPIEEPLRATLRMLGKLNREHSVTPDDMRAVLGAGVSPEQIKDALAVSFAFNTINRLADAFGFEMLSPQGFEAGAKYLLRRGYR